MNAPVPPAGGAWPRISIVTANLNQGRFLEETMQSVLAQDYPDLEYIVIDGGSTDGSRDIIARHASRLAYHCSEPDAGHYDAVNKGLARATGEVQAFLNADDKYFPGALRIVGEVFAAHPGVSWLTSLLPAAWDLAGHCIDVTPQPGYSRAAFLDGYYGGGGWSPAPGILQQESTFWRRSLWDAAGGRLRTEVSHAADFDLWARFYAHAELCGLRALLGGFRLRAGQRLQEGNRYAEQTAAVLNGTPRPWRGFVRRAGLGHLPQVGKRLRQAFGYPAQRLVRRRPDQPDAAWELESYRFL